MFSLFRPILCKCWFCEGQSATDTETFPASSVTCYQVFHWRSAQSSVRKKSKKLKLCPPWHSGRKKLIKTGVHVTFPECLGHYNGRKNFFFTCRSVCFGCRFIALVCCGLRHTIRAFSNLVFPLKESDVQLNSIIKYQGFAFALEANQQKLVPSRSVAATSL